MRPLNFQALLLKKTINSYNERKTMKLFEKKVILITGGTGSFGKTITEYLLDYNLKEIRVFSRDEKKQEDMRLSLNNNKLK